MNWDIFWQNIQLSQTVTQVIVYDQSLQWSLYEDQKLLKYVNISWVMTLTKLQ